MQKIIEILQTPFAICLLSWTAGIIAGLLIYSIKNLIKQTKKKNDNRKMDGK